METRAQHTQPEGLFMLWKTLLWNWVNISAIAAFGLLPVAGLASGPFDDAKTGTLASLTAWHAGVSNPTASFDAPAMTR
jgi:hypothetical protein